MSNMGNCIKVTRDPNADLLDVDPALIVSPPCKGRTIPARVTEVYDGDTCTVIMFIPAQDGIHHVPFKTHIRINGIDTPEVRSSNVSEKAAGKAVKEYCQKLLLNQIVSLTVIDNDKYGGRIVGTIVTPGGINISDHLISMRYAHCYDGECKKKPWTYTELLYIAEQCH